MMLVLTRDDFKDDLGTKGFVFDNLSPEAQQAVRLLGCAVMARDSGFGAMIEAPKPPPAGDPLDPH